MDDYPLSAGLTLKAQKLRRQFEETYWDEELGTYALALDGAKRACSVRSSNAGQVLFTGVEKRGGERERLGAVAVARKSERDQRVVMRPHRAVVIGRGVEAPLAPRERADAPAAE